jgi:hypothetical protein
MAQHGYLREYDEGWDRGADRDREWRERERGWRGESDFRDRDPERNRFMLGTRDRSERDRDRQPLSNYDREQRGDWTRAPRDFGSSQDEHYRSWRDKQMEALDRDYAEYCRARAAVPPRLR